MPIAITAEQTIYVVGIKMTSPFQGSGKDLNEFKREITYKKDKKTRKGIGAIRTQVNMIRHNLCMRFFSVEFTNEKGRETLIRECQKADLDMKKIDPLYHVSPAFIPVQVSALSAGNMFDSMRDQLSVQVHQRILDRVRSAIEQNTRDDGTQKQMTTKTRTALLKMLDQVKEINILNDPNVTAQIEGMKERIKSGNLIPIRNEILSYLDEVTEGDNLEITFDKTDAPRAEIPREIVPVESPTVPEEKEPVIISADDPEEDQNQITRSAQKPADDNPVNVDDLI